MLTDLVFDWSGTISDDIDAVIDCINGVLHHFGSAPIDKEYLRKNYKKDPMDFYSQRGIEADPEEVNEIFLSCLCRQEKPKLIDGVKEVLETLKEKDHNLYIVSTHPYPALIDDVERHGLSDIFPLENIIGDSRDKARSIRWMNIDHDSAMIGDTYVDIEAGKDTGLKTIAVLGGYQERSDLERYSPDHIIRNMRDILEIADI